MMGDIDELMDEVASTFIVSGNRLAVAAAHNMANLDAEGRAEETDIALSSISNSSEPDDASSANPVAHEINEGRERRCTVVYVESASASTSTSNNSSQRTKRKSSAAWDHFNPIEGGKAECRYCEKILSIKTGASGNLFRHLKKKHGMIENTQKILPRDTSSPVRPSIRARSRSPITSFNSESADELESISPVIPSTFQLFKGSEKRMKRKSSAAWYHFNSLEGGKAQCRYCENILSIKTGASGNLFRHLKKKHGITENSQKSSSKDTSSSLRTSSGVLRSQSHSPTADSYSGSADELDISAIINSTTSPSKNSSASTSANNISFSEPSLPHRGSQSKDVVNPVPVEISKKMNAQLLKMIVKEYHPFDIVEDAEFQKFVHLLCPGYSLPSKKALTNSMMPMLYQKMAEQVKSQLKISVAVALTTDSWSSPDNITYLAVTVHFLDEETKMKSFLLGCIEFTSCYNAVEISIKFKTMCEEWDIHDKVTAVVTDNSINMVAAMREINFLHLPCFAHTINLIVQNSTKKISCTLNKCKNLVKFFEQNPHAMAKLNTVQEQMDVSVVKLKQSINTRWNSSFEMLERILMSKEPLTSTLALLQVEEKLQLSTKDWHIIEQSVEMLRVFYEITVEMSLGKNVTLSNTFLLKNMMKHRVELYLTYNNLEIEISEMGKELLIQISGTLEGLDSSELITQATLLDPRFKKFGFGGDEWAFTEVYNSLVGKLGTISIEGDDNGTSTSSPTQKAWTTPNTSLWDEFDEKVNQLAVVKNPKDAGIVELDKFLVEPLLDRSGDPLEWWNRRRHIYPKLYSVISKILCIPATSLPCERIFSKTGNASIEKRNRFSSKNLSMILFLNHNLS